MSPMPSTVRASIWEWVQTVLLCANLLWTTLCLGGFLPGTMVVTSVLTAALLFVYAIGEWLDPRGMRLVGISFIPFLVYAAANVVWVSPVRWLGWIDWFNWAEAFAVFWIVVNAIRSPRCQTVLFGALLGVAGIAVWLACYQRFLDPKWIMLGRTQAEQYVGRASGPFGIPNSLAALLLLLIPVVGVLAFRRHTTVIARIFFGWLLAVLVFGLGLTVSRGAWLGLALALTAWPALGGRTRWRRRVGVAGAVAAGLVAVGFIVYSAVPVAHERFTQLVRDAGERSRPILWRAGWQMFQEHPVLGAGAGSFNVRFEKYRPEGFVPQPLWAHNDYLNTLSDYGAVGFTLLFGAALIVGLTTRFRQPAFEPPPVRSPSASIARRDWLDDPVVWQGLGIGLLAFALQLFVDFHFKIPALAMTFACIAGLLLSRTWPRSNLRGTTSVRFISPVVAALTGLVVVFAFTPLYRGEALRLTARETMDKMAKVPLADSEVRARLAEVRRELDRATGISPSNGQAWADRAYALAQISRFEPAAAVSLGRLAEDDANRAIGLSPIVAEFWIRRGVALDVQYRWTDAGPDFAQALVLSPNAVLAWYHYAYHMSLRPTGLDMANAAVEFCLRLDPANPEVQRLRQRLASSSSGS